MDPAVSPILVGSIALMRTQSTIDELALVEVIRAHGGSDGDDVRFETARGDVHARYHPAAGGEGRSAVVWMPDSSGLDARHAALAERLRAEGVESLRLDYRSPGRVRECLRDALVGARWLCRERGVERLVLIGTGYGAAVALSAAPLLDEVTAIAALDPGPEQDEAPAPGNWALLMMLGRGQAEGEEPSAWLVQRTRGPVTTLEMPESEQAMDDALHAWLGEAFAG